MLQSKRVLVVDDNEDAAEVLAMVLRAMGHDVRTASDGKTALAEAASFHPEVAWLDLGMPGMNGLDVARALRSSMGQQCYLVALSGYGDDKDREATQAAGFDLHVMKPTDLSRIRQIMASLPA